MPVTGDYEPSPWEWVQTQVADYEASGGTRANTLLDTGLPIVILTTRGARSGKVRKSPVMRVAFDGSYAVIASKGGAPSHPEWYRNLLAHPGDVMLQDGPQPMDVEIREVTGEERAEWWRRAVEAYPPYAEYQERTAREIPVIVATPKRA